MLAGSSTHDREGHQKSRFLDQPGLASSSHHHLGSGSSGANGSGNAGHLNGNALNDSSLTDSQLLNTTGNQLNGLNSGNGASSAAAIQSNQIFEKILSEVIHVSAYDQRGMNGGYMGGDLMGEIPNPPVQDMPFKLKGNSTRDPISTKFEF